MKKIKYLLLTLGLIAGFGLAVVPTSVSAANATDAICQQNPSSPLCATSTNDSVPKIIQKVVNALLYVLAAVAVIVIIFSGIFYTTSSGDPKLVEKAKNTLFYAIVGLIVAILAYAIVNFVIGLFPATTPGTNTNTNATTTTTTK